MVRSSNNGIGILTRTQEISGAYVRSFVFKNFNPLSRPARRHSSSCPSSTPAPQTLDAKQQTEVGGMYGAGIAYEISPSFDIRAEYRGIRHQGAHLRRRRSSYNFTTNRWYNISVPTIGVAYHF